jgi:hypothetical protein
MARHTRTRSLLVMSSVVRERCPYCGAKNAAVTYKVPKRGDGRIAGEYRDGVRCPNVKCPGKPA